MADNKPGKITIIRATVFDGAPVDVGAVCDVTDHNRAAAHYLLARGKAVEGDVGRKPDKPSASNKTVTDTEKK